MPFKLAVENAGFQRLLVSGRPDNTRLFRPIVSWTRREEINRGADETIFRFSRRHPETPRGYQSVSETAPGAASIGDSQMRTLSFILALAFILAGPSMAGSSDGSLPGIGTFSYGSPITADAAVLVAAR